MKDNEPKKQKGLLLGNISSVLKEEGKPLDYRQVVDLLIKQGIFPDDEKVRLQKLSTVFQAMRWNAHEPIFENVNQTYWFRKWFLEELKKKSFTRENFDKILIDYGYEEGQLTQLFLISKILWDAQKPLGMTDVWKIGSDSMNQEFLDTFTGKTPWNTIGKYLSQCSHSPRFKKTEDGKYILNNNFEDTDYYDEDDEYKEMADVVEGKNLKSIIKSLMEIEKKPLSIEEINSKLKSKGYSIKSPNAVDITVKRYANIPIFVRTTKAFYYLRKWFLKKIEDESLEEETFKTILKSVGNYFAGKQLYDITKIILEEKKPLSKVNIWEKVQKLELKGDFPNETPMQNIGSLLSVNSQMPLFIAIKDKWSLRTKLEDEFLDEEDAKSDGSVEEEVDTEATEVGDIDGAEKGDKEDAELGETQGGEEGSTDATEVGNIDGEDIIDMEKGKTPLTKPDYSFFEGFEVKVKEALIEKGQIILMGPPGTSKTFLATQIARDLAQYEENFKIVQFHPEYSYEQFVRGWDPIKVKGGIGFECKDRIFVNLCEQAIKYPDQKFVLIIDEINRGNVEKIFGELIFAIEKRGEPVTLMYDAERSAEESVKTKAKSLTVPNNLFIIGTMNTVDLSITNIDAALLRRFFLIELYPDSKFVKKWIENEIKEIDAKFPDLKNQIATLMDDINTIFENGAYKAVLGKHRKIGQTYYMMKKCNTLEDVRSSLKRTWEYSIIPLLLSYLNFQDDHPALGAIRAKFEEDFKKISEIK